MLKFGQMRRETAAEHCQLGARAVLRRFSAVALKHTWHVLVGKGSEAYNGDDERVWTLENQFHGRSAHHATTSFAGDLHHACNDGGGVRFGTCSKRRGTWSGD